MVALGEALTMESKFEGCRSSGFDEKTDPIAVPKEAPEFEVIFRTPEGRRRFIEADLYSCAKSFIEGRFDIWGDPVAAVAYKMAHPGTRTRRYSAAVVAWLHSFALENWLQTRIRAGRNIEFHYDRSEDFYAAFLDSRRVYSCAYFRHPGMGLDEAQEAKLDLICRKLYLQRGERFLDIGCGWGALLVYASERYGAISTGCTLSPSQAEFAVALSRSRGLDYDVNVRKSDFRDVSGRYDKIASVGMFEHVGRKRLRSYFSKVYDLLAPDGLFLNHGIVRPEGIRNGPDTRFLRKYVFPGGELAHLSEVVEIAGKCGFEVLDVEGLRPHYAMTCRRWVERLVENRDRCIEAAGQRTYRIWLLYLSASALSFERAQTDVCQVLMAKRSGTRRRLTREYMFQLTR
jgi:cyclopropane-fatty-acyl-phospholipid synthase